MDRRVRADRAAHGAIKAQPRSRTRLPEKGRKNLPRTDTKVSPWYVVNSDNKKQARLNCIAHLLSRVPYNDLNPVEIALPPRQSDSDYKRPKISSQRFVPDIY